LFSAPVISYFGEVLVKERHAGQRLEVLGWLQIWGIGREKQQVAFNTKHASPHLDG
jgi:hypothetical protein